MQRPSHWPAGPNFYAAQRQRPPLYVSPVPVTPWQDWGRIERTSIWQDTGWPCPDAGQASDAAWYAELIADPRTPNSMKPYLERNRFPPEPGSREYMEVIRPQFRYGPSQEQHWIDWWYGHFTSDSPGPRYTIPTPPPPPAEPPPAEPPPPRPPRDWPEQAPPAPPVEPPPDEPFVPTSLPPTVTTTPQPPTQAPAPVPWGWVVGGSAVALLLGGGIAYALTRPKRPKARGRRRRR